MRKLEQARAPAGVLLDLTGHVYGRLTVLQLAKPPPSGGTRWECRCACGNVVLVATGDLRRTARRTISCGCYRREHGFKHGKTGTPIYFVWFEMRRRCQDPTNVHYADYGGRGIKVCQRWQTFENFYQDMGDIPPGKTLDRIHNDGPYVLENCRWATIQEQSRNKRNNVNITFEGKTQCLADWARDYGLHFTTLRYRIRQGWPLERALRAKKRSNQHG